MSYIVEGYWDCAFCHTKGIKGSARECPGCGKPRGKDVEFYLKEYSEENAIEDASTEADWLCEFCDSLNPAEAEECLSCGAKRSETTYKDFRETAAEEISDADGNMVADEGEISEDERDEVIYARERADREKMRGRAPAPDETESGGGQQKKPWPKFAGIAAAVAAVLFLVYWMLSPSSVSFTVDELSWERNIAVDAWQTVDESSFDPPSGARVYDTKREIKSYNHVIDHYEKYQEQVSERVIDHYETKRHKKDLGNGKFEITETKEPVYKTKTKTVTKERPVYADVPVYGTKSYYKVEKWSHVRDVHTSGKDKNPQWGALNLAQSSREHEVGKERESGRAESYYVTGTDKNGRQNTYKVDFAWWQTINVGDKIEAKADSNGHLQKKN
ncbi:MAG: hypothetical protein J6Z82_05960 [Schwartzia sp.]|nr:hypothetical protein [Schwartzia sp. (in: firmicutes)]